ncbi:hypothetical protein Droror1_Dr00019794 [Drosera rotundifolia]
MEESGDVVQMKEKEKEECKQLLFLLGVLSDGSGGGGVWFDDGDDAVRSVRCVKWLCEDGGGVEVALVVAV